MQTPNPSIERDVQGLTPLSAPHVKLYRENLWTKQSASGLACIRMVKILPKDAEQRHLKRRRKPARLINAFR
jgi:hypothetical protein